MEKLLASQTIQFFFVPGYLVILPFREKLWSILLNILNGRNTGAHSQTLPFIRNSCVNDNILNKYLGILDISNP